MKNADRIVAVLTLFLLGCPESSSERAQDARAFVQELGYKPLGVACGNNDGDGDGYVSCTVRTAELAEPLAVECASAYAPLKSGCRMQKPGLPRR